jgi:hypothetical protein
MVLAVSALHVPQREGMRHSSAITRYGRCMSGWWSSMASRFLSCSVVWVASWGMVYHVPMFSFQLMARLHLSYSFIFIFDLLVWDLPSLCSGLAGWALFKVGQKPISRKERGKEKEQVSLWRSRREEGASEPMTHAVACKLRLVVSHGACFRALFCAASFGRVVLVPTLPWPDQAATGGCWPTPTCYTWGQRLTSFYLCKKHHFIWRISHFNFVQLRRDG